MTSASLLTTSVNEAPVNGFATSDNSQMWVDLLASAFDGLIMMPFALLFVWGVHRLNLNRWIPVTAAMATVFSLVAAGLTHEFIAPIFSYGQQLLEMVGLHRFMYLLSPGVLVCFVGALALAWRRKLHNPVAALK